MASSTTRLLPQGSSLGELQQEGRSYCFRAMHWVTANVDSTLCAMTNIFFPLGGVFGGAGLIKADTAHTVALVCRVLGGFSLGTGTIFTIKFVANIKACAAGGPRWQAFLGLAVLASGIASTVIASRMR